MFLRPKRTLPCPKSTKPARGRDPVRHHRLNSRNYIYKSASYQDFLRDIASGRHITTNIPSFFFLGLLIIPRRSAEISIARAIRYEYRTEPQPYRRRTERREERGGFRNASKTERWCIGPQKDNRRDYSYHWCTRAGHSCHEYYGRYYYASKARASY